MSVQQLDDSLQQLKIEWKKFEGGNKSAGTRARKILSEIKTICSDMRKEVQTIKEGRAAEDK